MAKRNPSREAYWHAMVCIGCSNTGFLGARFFQANKTVCHAGVEKNFTISPLASSGMNDGWSGNGWFHANVNTHYTTVKSLFMPLGCSWAAGTYPWRRCPWEREGHGGLLGSGEYQALPGWCHRP
jgi:hypothetical protein